MTWEYKILKVDNGYIIEWEEEAEICEEGETISFIKHKLLIEEQDSEFGELEAMQKLLIEIKEHFGIFYSKHNQKNIKVEIK